MLELPQVELPGIVYNSVVSGLASALAWHAINVISVILPPMIKSLQAKQRPAC
jgi:hypothetical protein